MSDPYKYNDDKYRPLTQQNLRDLHWAIQFVKTCLPPEKRNQSKNGGCQEAFDRLRGARKALRKVRELKGQGL